MTTPLAAKIAREYGTPAAVIDMDKVERNIARDPGRLRCRRRRQPPAYQDPQEPDAGKTSDRRRRSRHHLPEARRGRSDGGGRDRRHPDQLQSDRRGEDGPARRAAGQGQHDGRRRQFGGYRRPAAGSSGIRPAALGRGRMRYRAQARRRRDPGGSHRAGPRDRGLEGIGVRRLHALPDRRPAGPRRRSSTTKRWPACARTGWMRRWSRPAARRT